jgi:hypothetical protein
MSEKERERKQRRMKKTVCDIFLKGLDVIHDMFFEGCAIDP